MSRLVVQEVQPVGDRFLVAALVQGDLQIGQRFFSPAQPGLRWEVLGFKRGEAKEAIYAISLDGPPPSAGLELESDDG